MTNRISELRALCDRATKAPWHDVDANTRQLLLPHRTDDRYTARIAECPQWGTNGPGQTKEQAKANAAFIAASREALPALLDLVEELEGALQKIKEDTHDLMVKRDAGYALTRVEQFRKGKDNDR